MSRTTTRVAALGALTLTTAAVGALFAPAALAAPAAPVVNPTAVAGDQEFTVSGVGCTPNSDPTNPVYAAAWIDFGPDAQFGIGDAVEPGPDGKWSVTLAIPAEMPAGAYPVLSDCGDYDGDYYFEYPDTSVTLKGAATAAPTTPAAPAAFVPGAKPNTPGIAKTSTSATTDATPSPGEKVVRVIKGFKPFEQVTLVMHSTPTVLGTFTADANGVLTVSFTLPAGTPLGNHTLAFDGNMGSHFEDAITVTAATSGSKAGQLAYTGADIKVPLIAGAGLVALGGATVVATRRRKADGAQA
jgi:LPXTG-motif cell wall-anchored protein